MRKNTFKIMMGSGITLVGIAAASVISHITTEFWVNVALARKLPKNIFKNKRICT